MRWNAVCAATRQLLSFLRRDAMLVLVCLAPLLYGLFTKAVPPVLRHFVLESFVAPYYAVFDLFFALISPLMFCFVAVMVLLEEADERLAVCLSVTPLGKGGYLASRLGLPALAALVVTLALYPLFHVTELRAPMALLLSLAGAAQAVVVTLLVSSLSANKLEGMALSKLTTLPLLGGLAPFFLTGGIQYLAAPLPAFWMGLALREGEPLWCLVSLPLSALWALLLWPRFTRRLSR